MTQTAILEPPPADALALFFAARAGADHSSTLRQLAASHDPAVDILGLGLPLVMALDREVPGLRKMPALVAKGIATPSTQGSLFILLRHGDRGALRLRARRLVAMLAPAFRLEDRVECFRHMEGRDLSGYEDGTENPKDAAAIAAAIVAEGAGMKGSSFVAVQKWIHALDRFGALPEPQRDAIIGRRHADNQEISDAPKTAHVKRAAQESFDPPAFMLRRSMPYAEDDREGLLFVSFVENLDRFERVLRRMIGLEDGQIDALFQLSSPVSGGYYWCPPTKKNGKLDLSLVHSD